MSKLLPTFLICLGLICAPAASGLSQPRDTVLFGVLAFGGDEDAQKRWGRTISYLSRRLPGRDFEIVPLTLDGAITALESRELHFLLTNPGHFEDLMVRNRLAPLVSLRTDAPGQRDTGNRFGAVIITRSENVDIQRLADLRGKRFGAVAPDAFGGWQLALHTLRRNGIDLQADFSELRFFGFPQSAIVRAVLDGAIDAGTVRTGVIEAMISAGQVAGDELRVLSPLQVPGFDLALSTALVPEWLIAATPQADPQLRVDVAGALLALEASPEDGPGWLPPQSQASVVEIRKALAQAELDEQARGGRTTWSAWDLGLVAAMIAIVVLTWRRRIAFLSVPGAPNEPKPDDPAQKHAPVSSLTPREQEILVLVEKGQTTKEIALALSISPKTVEFHRHNLMQKFGAANMADLVHRAGEWRHQSAD